MEIKSKSDHVTLETIEAIISLRQLITRIRIRHNDDYLVILKQYRADQIIWLRQQQQREAFKVQLLSGGIGLGLLALIQKWLVIYPERLLRKVIIISI
jgi:hypothetical protein